MVTAERVPTLPVLACIVDTILADTAFRALLEVNVPAITLVTADNVPTLPVLACIVLTMLAVTAFRALLDVRVPPRIVPTTFALPAFKSVLEVIA